MDKVDSKKTQIVKTIKRSQSEINFTAKQLKRCKKRREKHLLKEENNAKMNSLVKSLEMTLSETQRNQEKHDEAKKENKQLLNVLQQQCCSNNEMSRSDISPSYSTVSMVHLQYKYEELLNSHEGLLKLLEAKVKEVRKCYSENEKLNFELKSLREHAEEIHKAVNVICEKYLKMKQRKERKIAKIKFERDTLKIAHDKLVHLLHRKCMEQDDIWMDLISKTKDCSRAQLLAEIRRSNKLQYENEILMQKYNCLEAKLKK